MCVCDSPVLRALCRGLISALNLKLKQDLSGVFVFSLIAVDLEVEGRAVIE